MFSFSSMNGKNNSKNVGFYFKSYKNNAKSVSEFYKRYKTINYLKRMPFDVKNARYFKKIKKIFALKDAHINALNRNGFIVLKDFLSKPIPKLYRLIYRNHLPVFITTDSILHALYSSFNTILKQIELKYFYPQLKYFLYRLKNHVLRRYYRHRMLKVAKRHVITYLKTAIYLLNGIKSSRNRYVNYFLRRIRTRRTLNNVNFFGHIRRFNFVDFSASGRYLKNEHSTNYFKAMIWMGRAYLTFKSQANGIMAFMLQNALYKSGLLRKWNEINNMFQLIIGQSDNATIVKLRDFVKRNKVSLKKLVKPKYYQRIVNEMIREKIGVQKIFSAVTKFSRRAIAMHMKYPVFNLFGQRYTIDADVLQTTVWNPNKVFPCSEYLTFAFGSNESLNVFKKDINKNGLKITTRLEKTRRMIINSNCFKDPGIYHSWIKAFSYLFPSQMKITDNHPSLIRTKAWANLKMNTMLSSYVQLKDATKLYTKRVYHKGLCDFPEGYVEPNPRFFNALKNLGFKAAKIIKQIRAPIYNYIKAWSNYFIIFGQVNRILEKLAKKQLMNIPYSENENQFIKRTLSLVCEAIGCGTQLQYDGWYYRLFYREKDAFKYFTWNSTFLWFNDYLGIFKQIRVRDANFAIFAVNCKNKTTLYVGPVYHFLKKKSIPRWAGHFLIKNKVKREVASNLEYTNITELKDEEFNSRRSLENRVQRMIRSRNKYKAIIDKMINPRIIAENKEPGVIIPFLTTASQENVFSMVKSTGEKYYHGTYCLFDNDVRTAWVTNKKRGIGAWIGLYFIKPKTIYKIGLRGGWDYVDPRFGDLFYTNNRVKQAKIFFYNKKNQEIYSKAIRFNGTRGLKYFNFPDVKAKKVKIVIKKVFRGYKYPKDTCINMLKIYARK